MQEYRPDPDALLASITKKGQDSRRAKLRIFVGMSAGVGKTYAMLSMAQSKLKEGVDLVIGTVDTHGRAETEKKLAGIPIIPRKKIEYRGVILEEMDLEAVLNRKPHIVVVDELAHSNAPGSRHPKRWQDVLEILENGISVYTALNIQHIESRKDDVEDITQIKIHETVPDSILERADHLEVVDIPVEDLLQRLQEGKVYLGEKAQEAQKNFFKQDKLTALRQILLRFSADKMDFELDAFNLSTNRDQIWKTQDKILLATGHGPQSEKLVRLAKQRATKLRCPWVAAYVDTGKELSLEDQKTLSQNLDLARELGAKVMTTTEADLITGIDRLCRQLSITEIIIGKPGFAPFRNFIKGGSIIERLNRLSNNVSIHLVRLDSGITRAPILNTKLKIRHAPYLSATIYVLALGLVNGYLHHALSILSYRTFGVFFLIGAMAAGLIFPLGATVWASLLAIQTWNFFFIPPLFTFRIGSVDDIGLALSFLVAATLSSGLMNRLKRQQVLLGKQEKKSSTLFHISREIVEASSKDDAIDKVKESLSNLFLLKIGITLTDSQGILHPFKHGSDWMFNGIKEWAVAQLCFDKNRPTGKWTDTLPHAKCMFIPLLVPGGIVGILGLYPEDERPPLIETDREILFTICSQLALYLQRENFWEASKESEKLRASEKLHQTLLNSVSHEIKTPLTAINGISEAISHMVPEKNFQLKQLNLELAQSVQRLSLVVDNILDISRIENGMLNLKLDWHDLNELVDNTLSSLKDLLKTFKVQKTITENFPLIYVDGQLVEQVLYNLILNSIKYSDENKEIGIYAAVKGDQWELTISDRGPGIPQEFRALIFNKFFRLPQSKPGGSGLGLSLAKSIVELHKGQIAILDSATGLTLHLIFPKYAPPELREDQL